MKTDHAKGSPWDAATNPAAQQPLVLSTSNEAPEVTPVAPGQEPSDASADTVREWDHGSDPKADSSELPTSSDLESAHRETHGEDTSHAMEFRVIREGKPARRLRLTRNHHTLGSAEGCSIRLVDQAICPTHAVLIRDGSRVVVRSYSIPVEVNGEEATEVELHPGDYLQIGSYRFELLSIDPCDGDPSQTDSSQISPGESISNGSSTHPQAAFDATDQRDDSTAIQSSDELPGKGQANLETEPWQNRQLEFDRRESRCDQREANLRTRESDLWSRTENLNQREARLQSQEDATSQLFEEYAKRQKELIAAREAARKKEETLQKREIAFRDQENEHRRQLDDVTRQLHLSQERADSATESLARLREQFESLTHEFESVSGQQREMECREEQHHVEHERLLNELKTSRNQAIEAQNASESRRQKSEKQVEQLQAQLAQIRDSHNSDLSDMASMHEKLGETQQVADTLHQQVTELQQQLATATADSENLRAQYDEAISSVRELESIVAHTSENRETDLAKWQSEAGDLRVSVETLSVELNQASQDLEELRDINSQLSAQLDDMQRQRDEAQADADSRPTIESFHSLQEELLVTKDLLAGARADHEDAIRQLDDVQRQQGQNQAVFDQESDEALIATEAANELVDQSMEPQSYEAETIDPFDPEPDFQADDSTTSTVGSQNFDDEDFEPQELGIEAIGTDVNETDLSESWDVEPLGSEASDELVIDQESEHLDSESMSDWKLESPELPENPLQHEEDDRLKDAPSNEIVASDSNWNPNWSDTTESDGWESRDDDPVDLQTEDSSDAPPESTWYQGWKRWEFDEDAFEEDESDELAATDSLASSLIRDLDEEAQHQDYDEPDERFDDQLNADNAPSFTSHEGWDQEREEESYPTQWSNDPEGYRVESFQVGEEVETADLDLNSPEEEFADESTYSDTHESEVEESLEMSVETTENNRSPSDANEEDDNESIEAYMNRLLNRVQGRSTDSVWASGGFNARVNVTADGQTEEIAEQREKPKPDEPLPPRSMAPERTTSLSALRELANSSARIAISHSVREQARDTQLKGMFNLLCALGATLCGIVCYYYIPGDVRYLAVLMTVIVATVYMIDSLKLFRDARQRLHAANDGQFDEEE